MSLILDKQLVWDHAERAGRDQQEADQDDQSPGANNRCPGGDGPDPGNDRQGEGGAEIFGQTSPQLRELSVRGGHRGKHKQHLNSEDCLYGEAMQVSPLLHTLGPSVVDVGLSTCTCKKRNQLQFVLKKRMVHVFAYFIIMYICTLLFFEQQFYYIHPWKINFLGI